MLDLYYAPSSTRLVPEQPGELEFAGSIDLDAHRSLAALFEQGRLAGADLQYLGDSMLKPEQVTILLRIFMANAPEPERSGRSPAAFDAVRDLLERAAGRGMGLVAFGD